MKEISISFSEDAATEISDLVSDLRLVPIASYLQKQDTPLPDGLQEHLGNLLGVLMDLFSIELPDLQRDPEATLRTVSRDIHLASILRERGVFRFHRLMHQSNPNGIPVFMSLINPANDTPFSRQEDFVGWFCQEAHISRALLFQRMATIDRSLEIGFDLENAFRIVVSHPYAIQETLREVATWGKGQELLSVDPDVIMTAAKRVDPGAVDQLEKLARAVKNNPDDLDARGELSDASKPILVKLMEEVSDQRRAKDALDFVKHDILSQPDITYTWDRDSNVLMVELTRREIAPTGEQHMLTPITIPFVPDVTESLPQEVIDDLLKRLPIRNRSELAV